MKLYPAIDLIGGRCVRLTQGSFDRQTQYEKPPTEVAAAYHAAGAAVIHVVDLDGARAGSPRQLEVIAAIAKASPLPLQVGGGVRRVEDAMALVESGAARVVIGSLAAKDRVATEEILRAVGPERITLAVDFRKDGDTLRVATHGWQETGGPIVADLIRHYAALGVRHVLCTDIDRDGTLRGPDVALYTALQNQFPEVELQVSGGIGALDDLRALKKAGARAVILGKALYEGKFTMAEAIRC